MNKELIRTLVRTMYDFQDMRIRMGNRLKKKKDGHDQKNINVDLDIRSIPVMVDVFDSAEENEKKLEQALKYELKKFPIYTKFLKGVKGVGPLMASVIISEYDIHIATTVSKLWAFTGLAPGKDKLVKGQKACFNKWLRTKMCGVLGASFLKSNSPYREFYDNMKHRLESMDWGTASKKPVSKKRPKAGHQHKAANRYMIKMFLKDLYVAWRNLEGLSVREPYSEEYLKKRHSA